MNTQASIQILLSIMLILNSAQGFSSDAVEWTVVPTKENRSKANAARKADKAAQAAELTLLEKSCNDHDQLASDLYNTYLRAKEIFHSKKKYTSTDLLMIHDDAQLYRSDLKQAARTLNIITKLAPKHHILEDYNYSRDHIKHLCNDLNTFNIINGNFDFFASVIKAKIAPETTGHSVAPRQKRTRRI